MTSFHKDPDTSLSETVRIVLKWICVGPGVRRAISDAGQVEDDEVRGKATTDLPSIEEAEACRGHSGHLVDGVFEPQHLIFHDKPFQDARELPVRAGLVRGGR